METPEKCVKFVQSLLERHQSDVIYVVLVSLLLAMNRFHILNKWRLGLQCPENVIETFINFQDIPKWREKNIELVICTVCGILQKVFIFVTWLVSFSREPIKLKEVVVFQLFERQPHKMVKHPELFECVWPSYGVSA